MKDYIFLQWLEFNNYGLLNGSITFSKLKFLVDFFSSNYNLHDTNIFTSPFNFYDKSFVYNDYKNKIFYIGSFDEKIEVSNIEQLSKHVNGTNSCKISYNNFMDLIEKLIRIKKNPAPFAIIYSMNNDWIYFKDFRFQEDMELFDQNVFQQFPMIRKRIDNIFLQMQLCVDIKQIDSYFEELEKIHSEISQFIFVEGVEVPQDLNNFFRDFDNLGDPWLREYLFNKIKVENYCLRDNV